MTKRLLILFSILFTLFLSSQVNAAIIPQYDNITGELLSIDYPVSALYANTSKKIWKYSVEVVHFKIDIGNGISKTIDLSYDEIRTMAVWDEDNATGTSSIKLEENLYAGWDAQTIKDIKNFGGEMYITSSIDLNWFNYEGDITKTEHYHTLEDIQDAMKKKSFKQKNIDDMVYHYPTGTSPIIIPKVISGDLILSEIACQNPIKLGQTYPYSYTVQSTFDEDKVSKLYAKVEFKDVSGNVLSTKTDNIDPYSMPNRDTKSEGDSFSPTDPSITSVTITVDLGLVADEADTTNNTRVVTIPVVDPNNMKNLKANNYVGDTNVNSTKPTIIVGANVTNESKVNAIGVGFTDVDFEVKVDGSVVTTFKSDIAASSTKNYTTTIPTPSPGIHKITVTVNPANNNPVEISVNDNAVVGTVLVMPVGKPNLKANYYIGDAYALVTKSQITVGANVNNVFSASYPNEKFTVKVDGSVVKTFQSKVAGNSTANYTTKIDTPSIGAHTVQITVNPDKNNPSDESNWGDNSVEFTVNITDETPPPPDDIDGKIDLYVSLANLNNVNAPWVDTTKDTFKSGYGIPLVVEVRDFTYTPKSTSSGSCSGQTSIDGDVSITSSTVTVESNDFDSYIFTNATPDMKNLVKISDSGESSPSNVKARFMLKNQETQFYPLGNRQLYTNPSQSDGTYHLTVTATVTISYDENYISGCDCCCKYCKCYCADWDVRAASTTITVRQTIPVKIKGSMWDDDEGSITR